MTKQTKYTKSARGQECQIRIPGLCNHDPETTVLAHLNGAGMGMKALDIHAAYSCSACHDAVDGRIKHKEVDDEIMNICLLNIYHLEGVIRTQKLMVENGILEL